MNVPDGVSGEVLQAIIDRSDTSLYTAPMLRDIATELLATRAENERLIEGGRWGRIRALEAERDELRTENERHRKTNLVRAMVEGYPDGMETIKEIAAVEGFDRVPWLVAQQAQTERDRLVIENERLRAALSDIVNASRDDGLAAMCNWMRGRALAALDREWQKDG